MDYDYYEHMLRLAQRDVDDAAGCYLEALRYYGEDHEQTIQDRFYFQQCQALVAHWERELAKAS